MDVAIDAPFRARSERRHLAQCAAPMRLGRRKGCPDHRYSTHSCASRPTWTAPSDRPDRSLGAQDRAARGASRGRVSGWHGACPDCRLSLQRGLSGHRRRGSGGAYRLVRTVQGGNEAARLRGQHAAWGSQPAGFSIIETSHRDHCSPRASSPS